MNHTYPCRCPRCSEKAVNPTVIEYHCKVKHENKLHDVVVPKMPVDKCDKCQVVLMPDNAVEIARAALRDKLSLIRGEAIRAGREALKLTQKEFGNKFGFADSAVSNWENGQVVSQSTNNFIRAYFAVESLRVFLDQLQLDPSLGESVIWTAEPLPHAVEEPTPTFRVTEAETISPEPESLPFEKQDQKTEEIVCCGSEERNKSPPVIPDIALAAKQTTEYHTTHGDESDNFNTCQGRLLQGRAARESAAIRRSDTRLVSADR